MPLLDVNNLSISFESSNGVVRAVNDISFFVEPGESVGIVGESGSGKSVTAFSILRLLGKRANVGGNIYFSSGNYSSDLLTLKEDEIRRHRGKDIAMVFQEPATSLNPVFRCGDQVTESLILHKKISRTEARNQTISLFEKVNLQEPERIFESYPHQLSGGQKQRVMIAMAISCDPLLLIADEPTTALDVTVQSVILKLLKELQKEKKCSLLFISHDLGVVSEIADRVIVMRQGKIVETGSVKEIFSHPKHPYTKGLIACRPTPDKKHGMLPTINDFLKGSEEKKEIETNRATGSQNDYESRDKVTRNIPNRPLLVAENICVHYPIRRTVFGKVSGYVRAVDGISFQLTHGETLGLVGESGCGKTTLGRALLRLQSLTTGKIVFDDHDLTSLDRNELRKMRKRIQIIFQDSYASLNPKLTIGKTILEPLLVHDLYSNDRKQRVMQLLDMVNLEKSFYKRYPYELSEGERQRVCIARALAPEPEFIICDEPVSSLDVSIQAVILNLLNKLKKELDFSSIFISHDLSVVKHMSDRIMVMREGKIIETGSADELYLSPKSAYTQLLIRSIPGQNQRMAY